MKEWGSCRAAAPVLGGAAARGLPTRPVGSQLGFFPMFALLLPRRKVPMFGLEAIWRDGQVVGHVRRADFGFAIDKTIAYGYIRDPAGGPVSTGGAACPRLSRGSVELLLEAMCTSTLPSDGVQDGATPPAPPPKVIAV